MWPSFVVFLLPTTYLPARIVQISKPVQPEALFTQPAMKALDMSILDGLTGWMCRNSTCFSNAQAMGVSGVSGGFGTAVPKPPNFHGLGDAAVV
jgi:hypothetical protein